MDAFLTSTFAVALAEIGDKTQLLSLLLASRFQNKPAIVLGILVATMLNHAASAWFGTWLSQFIMGDIGRWALAIGFFLMALWLLIPDKDDDEPGRMQQYGAFTVTLVLFFIAEIGDKTQVATVALAAQYQTVWLITLGTTTGMLLANVPVVYAGQKLMQKIPFSYTRIAASLAFVVVGISTLLT